jgi:hypothetical protein
MIYLIITTSINEQNGLSHKLEDRIRRYKESISKTLALLPECIKPIIVENNGKRKTFLDDFNIPVHYTDNNNIRYLHKGVNEMLDIHSVIKHFSIQDDDIIIKITGRYHPLKDSFFKTIATFQNIYDVFIKYFNVCSQTFEENDCVLGMFAMRSKYLKRFEYHTRNASAEVQFAIYTRSLQCNIYKCDKLDLHCIFADSLIELDV